MNVGDKVMCEGVITADGEGFYRVQFPRVGTQAVAHVRVTKDRCQPVSVPKATPVAEQSSLARAATAKGRLQNAPQAPVAD